MRAVAITLMLACIGSCTSIVQVDDYTFDVDPCAPRATACTGGRELAFIIRASDYAHADAAGHRDGVDLDGTDASICGQTDFVAPDGRRAIDDQMGPIFELYEDLSHTDLSDMAHDQALAGTNLALVVLSHVDDIENDDCIGIDTRTGYLPDGMTAADLDGDGDGLIDPGLTFDYASPPVGDDTACSIDHVIQARFPATLTLFPSTMLTGTVDRSRIRMSVGVTESNAVFGGSIRVADLAGLPPAVVEFIRPRADLDPSSRRRSRLHVGVVRALARHGAREARPHARAVGAYWPRIRRTDAYSPRSARSKPSTSIARQSEAGLPIVIAPRGEVGNKRAWIPRARSPVSASVSTNASFGTGSVTRIASSPLDPRDPRCSSSARASTAASALGTNTAPMSAAPLSTASTTAGYEPRKSC